VSQDVPNGDGGALAGFGPGSRIAGYVLEEQVGAGGMAVVFRAYDHRLDRQVALKILAPALAADQAFRQRFIRESRAAAAVDDPHIIPVFEAGEADGMLFIAMRYVKGGDVRSLLAEFGSLAPARVAEIVSQVSSALDAAHERGLVHRDVKPANMLLDSRAGSGRPDHVYLSDFGLSKVALSGSSLTSTGMFMGTVDYVSPEQIEGKQVDGRADQYALACAAFELLAGAPPFRREEVMAVIYAQMSQPAPAVTSLRPDLAPEVDTVFARALAKAPGDRWGSCREFAEALRASLGIASYDTDAQATQGTTPPTIRQQTQLADWRPTGGDPGLGSGAAGVVGMPDTKNMSLYPEEAASALTETHPAPGPEPVARRRRPAWRSPAALAGVLVVLLAAGGGGAYLARQKPAQQPPAQPAGHSPSPTKAPAVVPLSALSVPGCTTTAAAGKTLTVSTKTVKLQYGNPYGIAVSRDGKYVFTTNPATLSMLIMTSDQTAAQQYHYYVAYSGEVARDLAITSNGQYVAIAVGNMINVQSATAAEQDASSANAATLVVPGVRPVTNATEVALSPDDRFAFVTISNSNELAVFNIGKALTTGQNQPGVFVGTVTLGIQPTGIAVSPDGLWLYVVSTAEKTTAVFGPSEGLISVLSIPKLETKPSSALVAQTPAGCSPTGVAISPDGNTVWVTAQASNTLLGFSAAGLRTDPAHALTARVEVGQTPTGVTLVDGGTKIIVADSNLNGVPGSDNLAVVDVALAVARKPALIGYIPTGRSPLRFAQPAFSQDLYVSDGGAAQIQIVDLSTLPAQPSQ
jgi:serine/threonine protein kinase/DNA-binding beta-propeller fold protein YncE